MEEITTGKAVWFFSKLAIGLMVVLLFVFGSWTVVKPGNQGLVIRLGSINRTIDEGFHFKIPLLEKVVKVNIQVRKSEANAEAASKDLQNVTTIIAVNYQLDKQYVATLYKEVGLDFDAKLISPALQEAVKSATAKYTAEELITKRELVKGDIKTSLSSRMLNNHITITEVNIVNFDFSPSFNKAIEAKVTAEQDALAAKNKLEQVKYEAEQRVVQSKAEAEAIKIQAEALKENKSLVELEAVKKWNGVLPLYTGNTMPFISLTK